MSRFSDLQRKRNAARSQYGIPQELWGGDLADELSYLPDDVLLTSYQRQRNPFNPDEDLNNKVLPLLEAEINRRGLRGGESRDTGGEAGATRNIGKKIGPILRKAAPIAAAFIPGVGPLAAAGIAAGGHVAGSALEGTEPWKLKLRDVAGSAALGAGGNLLRGAIGGAGDAAEFAGEGALIAEGGRDAVSGGVSSGLKKLADFVKADPLRAAQLGLAAVGTINAAQGDAEAQRFRARAAGALDEPEREDLSSLFTANDGNPYGQQTGSVVNSARRSLRRGY